MADVATGTKVRLTSHPKRFHPEGWVVQGKVMHVEGDNKVEMFVLNHKTYGEYWFHRDAFVLESEDGK